MNIKKLLFCEVLKEINQNNLASIGDYGCGNLEDLELIHRLSSKPRLLVGFDVIPSVHLPYFTDLIYKNLIVDNIDFFHDKLDLVYCSLSFHHFDNPKAELNKIYNLLKPNSFFIVIDYISDSNTSEYMDSFQIKELIRYYRFKVEKEIFFEEFNSKKKIIYLLCIKSI